jgi:hypothetical protein
MELSLIRREFGVDVTLLERDSSRLVRFHILAAVSIIRAMKETASTSETSVNFCQTTRCNVPAESHIHWSGNFTAMVCSVETDCNVWEDEKLHRDLVSCDIC